MSSESKYHIYAKGKCLWSNLSEEDFQHLWASIQGALFVGIHTNYKIEDFDYEKVELQKEVCLSSSH